jgi:fructose-1,6-bisphosphatase/sedoheptulose 1,7-bisphosphatase-like protein
MKNTILRDITPCSPLKFNEHSRGTDHLHLQGQRIGQARNQHESRRQYEECRLLGCGAMQIQDLHDTASQKMAFFILTTVKTSNLTKEAICFSKTLVNFQDTTGCYIPAKDTTVHIG